jgi:hypothetical protein
MSTHDAPVVRRLPLGEIADVRGGYVGPNATTEQPGPQGWCALQGSDVPADGDIGWGDLRHSQPVRDADRYAVRPGDVLLPLRTTRPRAVALTRVPVAAIAVGQWAIMTPFPKAMEPAYLAWYLNHPAVAARLARVTQGSKLPFLSLGAIREFEVDVPPITLQRNIARVGRLAVRVTQLEGALTIARQKYLNAVTMDALHRAGPPTTMN